ncbi:unnamed protein product [Cuscuta epithymum]|uniref:Uncharacterized protein n=1 Tax=Cuscuta epithymum TaxID=186058 RepID=A0AAV0GGY8_9ASTE|nr:unnamed protein product [Cuscuta epithymum]
MNSVASRPIKDYGRLSDSNISISCRVFEPSSSSNAKHRTTVLEWLNDTLPGLSLPVNASDEELRAFLVDGSVLCQLLNKLEPGSVIEDDGSGHSWESCSQDVRRFLFAMDKMRLPRFRPSDLEYGSMKIIVDCLLTLKTHFVPSVGEYKNLNMHTSNLSGNASNIRWKGLGEHIGYDVSPPQRQESRQSNSSQSSRRASHSPVVADPSSALLHQVGNTFKEVFQVKHGSYVDRLPSNISELKRSNSLNNAPTHSLLSFVNGIIDESIERKNGVPERVALLFRKVVQETERRISTQAEHLRMQSDMFKAREEKYLSRIRDLEALATGADEVTEELSEKKRTEEKMRTTEHDGALLKVNDIITQEDIGASRLELEGAQRSDGHNSDVRKNECAVVRSVKRNNGNLQRIATLEKEPPEAYEEAHKFIKLENNDVSELIKGNDDDTHEEIAGLKKEPEVHPEAYKIQSDVASLMKGNDAANQNIAALKQELEANKKASKHCSQNNYKDDITKLVKEKEDSNKMIAILKLELETARETYEQHIKQMKTNEHNMVRLMKEKDDAYHEVAVLKQELEAARKAVEQPNPQMGKSENDLVRLIKEKDDAIQEIASLKKELEGVKKSYEEHCLQMKTEERDVVKLMKEKNDSNQEVDRLKKEFEETKRTYEQQCLQMKTETTGAQHDLEKRLKQITSLEERLKKVTEHFSESQKRVEELEKISEEKSHKWSKIQHIYQIFTEFQLGALRELKFSSQSVKSEVVKTQKTYSDEFNQLGVKVRSLEDAAANYSVILAENRKLHNEVQELKGNIRVYCRIRPFLPGQKDKQAIVEYIGDNGELIIVNPSKQGKEGRRSFKFNTVYGQSATQAQVYADIQPLVQSVLDGYNACIFAYGQTGSGKTYTMTGPDGATEDQWGVNYRALNDLFRISQDRGSAFSYEITVQMVEIYNEQVRDLLSNDSSQKRLGVLTTSQPNGLAVPDASMFPVNQPSDVLDLMNIGLKTRAKSSTSMNERSSRSHSILTIHIRGTDKKSGSSMRSSLHLVDLAGSERVDRSEVSGDRLKEAQHINKSLAALGDVISALATKSPHIPYRNSKLTQVLQSSLGGQAKTLMFVQLNPDGVSYSESLSTLKFAERASGVELGAAKSNKEGKDVRELMEQVTTLKGTLAAKDDEITKLKLIKDPQKVKG